jgi:hypothetical protein
MCWAQVHFIAADKNSLLEAFGVAKPDLPFVLLRFDCQPAWLNI